MTQKFFNEVLEASLRAQAARDKAKKDEERKATRQALLSQRVVHGGNGVTKVTKK